MAVHGLRPLRSRLPRGVIAVLDASQEVLRPLRLDGSRQDGPLGLRSGLHRLRHLRPGMRGGRHRDDRHFGSRQS